MLKKVFAVLVLFCGIFFGGLPTIAFAQENLVTPEAAPAVPAPAVAAPAVAAQPPITKLAKDKEPPKISGEMRKKGLGGDGSGARDPMNKPAPISIFAFSGLKCPAGSSIYKGPETKLAAPDNIVYCVFTKEVIVLPKIGNNGCQGMFEPYIDPKVKPDDDVIWCKKAQTGNVVTYLKGQEPEEVKRRLGRKQKLIPQ